jgi:hypothetical protein
MKVRAVALVLLLGATCVIASSSAVDAALDRPAESLFGINAGSASPGLDSPSSSQSPKAQGQSSKQSLSGLSQSGSSGGARSASASASVAAGTTSPSSSASPIPSAGVGTGVATTAAPSPDLSWLNEINRYRTAAGLSPVSDEPTWDAGILSHLNYVAQTPKALLAGPYASLHTENPASSTYTSAGALEAGRSDLYFGSTGLSPVQFVDGWLSAPFHAIGMLRARLTQVAYAGNSNAAGLDVISGLDDNQAALTTPILFPGNGMTTNLTSYTGDESPDPLETCGWTDTSATYGLPLIMLLPKAPKATLGARVTDDAGDTPRSVANGGLCVVDETTYRSSDPVYGQTGEQILQDDHAVLLMAKVPYGAGHYTVNVTQPGRAAITWSFTVAP